MEQTPKRPELILGRHAFGADPAAYDAARRDYPPALFDQIEHRLMAQGVKHAFEIGPGTGKATTPMLNSTLGIERITAIEPDPRLAAWLRRHQPSPRLTLIETPFEEAKLPEGTFDLGYAATSFHWLDAPSALARVIGLLRPGGHWAMWWNVYHDPERADPFRDEVTPIIQDLRAQAPSFHGEPHGALPLGLAHALNVDARVSELAQVGFHAIEADRLQWEAHFDTVGICALYASFSYIREVPPDAAQATLDQIAEIAETRYGGQVTRACVTQLYLAQTAA